MRTKWTKSGDWQKEGMRDRAWLADLRLAVSPDGREITMCSVQFGTGAPWINLETGSTDLICIVSAWGPSQYSDRDWFMDLDPLTEIDVKLLLEGHVTDRLRSEVQRQLKERK
ncbi:MAG TPA: hypothetical protein VF493_20025 [Terriglobales bacterium]